MFNALFTDAHSPFSHSQCGTTSQGASGDLTAFSGALYHLDCRNYGSNHNLLKTGELPYNLCQSHPGRQHYHPWKCLVILLELRITTKKNCFLIITKDVGETILIQAHRCNI